MAIENHPSVRDLVRRTLDAPGDAREALPVLLDALDHEDPVVRVGVAWAICAVTIANPDDAPDVVQRLEGTHGHTASMAATWIRRELELDGTDGTPGDLPARRSEQADGTVEDDTAEHDPNAPARPSQGAKLQSSPPEEESANDAGTDDASTSGSPVHERPDQVVQNGQFTLELDRTNFDSLEIVERVASDRNSWTYAGIASVNAERHAVLVRTYRPPQGARLSTFSGAFETAVTDWDGVDDHENVLSVHDYGRRPHPWIVTQYAPRTLRSVGRLPVEAALSVGLDAATGLGHAHERGITHRSLDPRAVALDSENGRAIGRLANFGIVDPFRTVDGPLPLDSRYAAPELFDSDHGAVDWLTDVYHLGAVLYTAFTGRPPYEESLVRRGGPVGLSYQPPSSVADGVPVAADRIVAKAMATHKIARYESADEFARDLTSALSEVEDGT
ncbi:protein kinase domain-containing protein [Salinarchaeum laminariae]|uniref:protein kinase domain-containing protein n=1 Tax=Salinarchaeum laminariae TaxID=869888 RepID=UPI0020BE72F6|nr:protein kinase [Salinarchaeum laminariae]